MSSARAGSGATARMWAAGGSLGAGAIHATAAGAHGEHRQAAAAFTVVALAQLACGAAALLARAPRWLGWAGLAVNGVAVVGWLAAKTSGIRGVEGLEAAEGPGFPDTLAALLAVAAMVGAFAWLTSLDRPAPAAGVVQAPAAATAALLVVAAMVATGGHGTGGGHDHATSEMAAAGHDHAGGGHDEDDDGHDVHPSTAGAAHDHAVGASHAGTSDHGTGGSQDHRTGTGPHGHPGPSVPGNPPHHQPGPTDPGDPPHEHPGAAPKPYDATLPVDLGGVPGVNPEQQASAEALVTDTLVDLPRFATTASAEAAGYRTIGDAFTGYEHFVNWPSLADGHILDAEHPESLVYRVNFDGSRTLTAAMYMLEPGATLDTVPDMGGPLVQWHIHNDLCYQGEEDAWQVLSSIYPPGTACPPGSFRTLLVPMLHVWIAPHPCGPFAALEGASGGQVPPGEEVLCDHAHGSG